VRLVGTAFTGNLVAVLPGLFNLALRYRKKRIRLSGEQATVLKVLKDHGGDSGLKSSRQLSPESVREILADLKNVKNMDGEFRALVTELRGRWHVEGV